MKSIRFIPTAIILAVLFAGCKTTQVVKSVQEEPKPDGRYANVVLHCAGLDLTSLSESRKTLLPSELGTELKRRVADLVQAEDIDGLYLKVSGQTPGLISELFAEAMLIKPYLVTCVVWSDEAGHQSAMKCMEEGSADMITALSDLRVTEKDDFSERADLPYCIKKTTARQVIGLDLSALFSGDPGGQTVTVKNLARTLVTDSEGKIAFVAPETDTIILGTPAGTLTLPTEGWFLPYMYSVRPDGNVARKAPWVEFRMMPEAITFRSSFDMLCKTGYPASVRINGDIVRQYKTGIFFKKVEFAEGANRVRATAVTPDSLTAFYEMEYIYEKRDATRKPFPLWIDERTVEPAADIELLPEDNVIISFRGSKGQEASVAVLPGKMNLKCSRADFSDYSIYRAELPLSKLQAGKAVKVILKLHAAPEMNDKSVLELPLKSMVMVSEPQDFPHLKVKSENSRLVYNLGAPRLGGPVRSELGPGVVLRANGKIGRSYRVGLSRTENGFISQDDVEIMPAETVSPSYYITSMSCGPGTGADIVTIPYTEPVPYEVVPEPDQNRIVITLFGVETANTWVSHRAGCKIIDKLTWEQTTPETYKIFVNLKSTDIWGYDLRRDGSRLVLRIKYPPVYDLANEKPLTGLRIAVEAGHGGSGTGAIGLSGLVEKDINLDLSFMLGDLLKSMGAEVVQVRDSDRDMSLIEKRDKAINSGANMLISIHANAGGTGYLSVGGTSTYWHNPFWAPLAETIYARLLETGLDEFGVVGSFNYTVTRVSQMPSVLVEQAFMTHAGDEEKLADPLFRHDMAQKIYEGIEDYLKYMKQ